MYINDIIMSWVWMDIVYRNTISFRNNRHLPYSVSNTTRNTPSTTARARGFHSPCVIFPAVLTASDRVNNFSFRSRVSFCILVDPLVGFCRTFDEYARCRRTSGPLKLYVYIMIIHRAHWNRVPKNVPHNRVSVIT